MAETTISPEQDNKPTLLEQILEKIDFKDCGIWGHGTLSKEMADQIMQLGYLGSRSYTLLNIVAPITLKDLDPAQNAERIVSTSKAWSHKQAKYIVLVSIPGGMRENFVLEHVEVKGATRTRLPSRFIRGYIDAITQEFIENPQFKQAAEPTGGLFPKEEGPVRRGRSMPLDSPAPDQVDRDDDVPVEIW